MLGNAGADRGGRATRIERNKLQPYVCDPVMVAKSGDELLEDEDAVDAMKKQLFPLATVVTPNRREAAVLTGADPNAPLHASPPAKDAARRIVGSGAKAVRRQGDRAGDQTVDLLFDGREFLEFAAKTQPKEKTHGSGCAFSAAITAGLANRLNLVDAIDQAKQLVNHGHPVQRRPGPRHLAGERAGVRAEEEVGRSSMANGQAPMAKAMTKTQ